MPLLKTNKENVNIIFDAYRKQKVFEFVAAFFNTQSLVMFNDATLAPNSDCKNRSFQKIRNVFLQLMSFDVFFLLLFTFFSFSFFFEGGGVSPMQLFFPSTLQRFYKNCFLAKIWWYNIKILIIAMLIIEHLQ